METKRMILARFADFDITLTNPLPWQPDVRFSKIDENNGQRAIKVHVNKIQYCRAV